MGRLLNFVVGNAERLLDPTGQGFRSHRDAVLVEVLTGALL